MLGSMFDFDDLRDIKPGFIRPISRDEYWQLAKLGAFEDENVELLRGVIVTMSPEDIRHADPIVWLMRRLNRALDDDFVVRPGMPFEALDDSVPQPDITITAEPLGRHPSTALLLIEVSNSSLRKDRRVKLSIYAEAGVPEYWIVNVSKPGTIEVEVYTQPSAGGYAKLETLRDGDVLRPLQVPIEIPVADLPR